MLNLVGCVQYQNLVLNGFFSFGDAAVVLWPPGSVDCSSASVLCISVLTILVYTLCKPVMTDGCRLPCCCVMAYAGAIVFKVRRGVVIHLLLTF
jgi:hypothetical protein